MAGRKATNWTEIRTAYQAEYAASGDVDLQILATRFNVNYGTLRNNVTEEWREEAHRMRQEVLAKTRAEAVPVIVRHRVDVIDRHLQYLGNLRQAALAQLGQLAQDKKLTASMAMRLVFDSLKAEKMLHDMVGDGPSGNMSEDEKRQAMYDDFLRRVMDRVRAGSDTPALAPPSEAAEA